MVNYCSKRIFPWKCLLVVWFCLDIATPVSAAYEEDRQAGDVIEIDTEKAACTQDFVYRIQSGGSFRYYRMAMSDMLYSTKRVFFWPSTWPKENRYQMPIFGAAEILFNDSLILADADALFIHTDSGMVALRKANPPGILYLRADAPATWQDLERGQHKTPLELPQYLYTWKDTIPCGLVQAQGRIPQEIDPYTPARKYRTYMVLLDTLPRLQLLPRYVLDQPKSQDLDTAYLSWLDRSIASVQKGLSEDSAQIDSFLTPIRAKFPPAMPKRPCEDTADYQERQRIHNYESLQLVKQVYEHNGFTRFLQPLRQRLTQLQERRSEVVSECRLRSDPDFRWLNARVWQRPWLFLNTALGQNLPDWAAEPGPSELRSIGLELALEHHLFSKAAWTLGMDGHFSCWRFNQDVSATSSDWHGSLNCGFMQPVWVSPSRNKALELHLGGYAAYRYTTVSSPGENFHDWGPSAGGRAALSFLSTPWPMAVKLEYRYGSDHFGRFALGLGIPLTGGRTP
ncbi:MAG TPA: hypothetical protein VLM37_02140 [Fibrobacteraceae bacterium]|nr:hypothetical protein [Fibrobacteraceae bacterium]